MHDVVIAGASVAGASTAIHLARRGRSVLLLDRRREPGVKACGEGLFPTGVAELRALGVLERVEANSVPLESIRFAAGGHAAEAPIRTRDDPALGIRRDVLAPALLETACEAGVEVRLGVRVDGLSTRAGRVRALASGSSETPGRAFVAADGLHSRIRALAGLECAAIGDRYGISAHVELPAPPLPRVDVYFADGFELYVTPVGGELVNVAILARRPFIRTVRADLEGRFQSLIAGQLPGTKLVERPRAAGPFPRGCARAWRANLVLGGDAAGFFDGITGEGMTQALGGARHCAGAVDAFLDSNDYAPLRKYDADRRSLARNSELLGRLTLALAARPALASRAIRNLARRPETFERLVAVNTGAAPLRALRPRDLSALLWGR